MSLLSKKVVNILIKKKISISTAESCTGGLLSSALTSVEGSSKIFNLGLITYSNNSKSHLLKVSKKLINTHGAVSRQVCEAMVNNLKKISKTKIAISITGIAGPGGGTINKPVGLVFIGVKTINKISINKYYFKNNGRRYIQKCAVKKSLFLVLNSLK